MQFNKCNKPHEWTQTQIHMIMSIEAEKVWQNLAHLYYKNPRKCRPRGNSAKHTKSYIRETLSQHHSKWKKAWSKPTVSQEQDQDVKSLCQNKIKTRCRALMELQQDCSGFHIELHTSSSTHGHTHGREGEISHTFKDLCFSAYEHLQIL